MRTRAPEQDVPVISTPGDRRDGNGGRFAMGAFEKAVGGVLTIILLGLLALIGTGRAYTIYGLPPRMDTAEKAISQLEVAVTKPRPMSSPEVEALAAAIVAALPQQPARKRQP